MHCTNYRLFKALFYIAHVVVYATIARDVVLKIFCKTHIILLSKNPTCYTLLILLTNSDKYFSNILLQILGVLIRFRCPFRLDTKTALWFVANVAAIKDLVVMWCRSEFSTEYAILGTVKYCLYCCCVKLKLFCSFFHSIYPTFI